MPRKSINGSSANPKAYFFRHIHKTDSCWLWTGTKNGAGYGVLWANSKTIAAYRFSYELHCGPIPEGLYCLHKCDNRACVNPDHLFLGTQKDNIRDMYTKGRGPDQVGSKNPNAKLTDEAVREIRALYSPGDVTLKDLASRYGVSFQHISRIIRRGNWEDVA